MVEFAEDREDIVQLDDEAEGDTDITKDYIFEKIGEPVPLYPSESDSVFDLENLPTQPLVISDRFGVIFVAHSEGFCVGKTKDVIQLAKATADKGKGSCVRELSLVDVRIGRVHILALSSDSSTLAATVGGEVYFYSVTSLLNKEQETSYSYSIGNTSVKDLRWRKNAGNSYIILSSHGMLYHGDMESPPKDVLENVNAVDWSVKGNYIAVARKSTLSILSSEFKEQFHMSLLFHSWINDSDKNCIIKVDSIHWVRHDSIIVGCIQLSEDGNEDGYLVQVITSRDSEITEASSKPVVRSFGGLFAGMVDDILPFSSGPYLFLSYLERWELMLAANRKNVDQHIVLLGWSLDGEQKEAVSLEFGEDKGVPRIELQENGDDNLIVGFGVDKVSIYEKIKLKGVGELKELSPYCILLCLTSEGKLIMFHVARMSDPPVLPQIHSVPHDDIAAVDKKNLRSKDHKAERVDLDAKVGQMGKEAVSVNIGQMGNIANNFSSKDPSESPLSSIISSGKTIKSEGQRTTLTARTSEYVTTDNPSPSLSGEGSSASPLSSIFSFSRTSQSEGQITTSTAGNSVFKPANHRSPSSLGEGSSSSSSSSIFSSSRASQGEGQRSTLTAGVNPEYVPATCRSPSSSGEVSALLKSLNSMGQPMLNNYRTHRSPGTLDSELELLKQFGNVSEMATDLDTLLAYIEEEGGFRDACTVYQKNSVLALEEGLKGLSERCRTWRDTMEERFSDIQLLRDKIVQVLGRKIYMENIVKQATNSQYWDLWDRQRLSPEFEFKRRQILKVYQTLTNQLIELERHFNTLELNKFGEIGRIPMNWRAFRSSLEPSRQIQSLHSLYNTMTSQLAAAEQLSECLSKQMATLNIESPPVKRMNVAKELFDSIGLTYDGNYFQSPDVKKAGSSPGSIKKLPNSSFSAIKEHSGRKTPSALKGLEPETARRRRDSLDRSWASFEPHKTTVKRMMQEEFSREIPKKSPFEVMKEVSNSQMEKRFSFFRRKDYTNPSSSSSPPSINKDEPNKYSANKDIQGKPLKQASESPSISSFKRAKDHSGPSQAVEPTTHRLQNMQKNSPQSSASVSSSTIRNNTRENLGLFERSTIGVTSKVLSDSSPGHAVSIYDTRSNMQSETPPSQTSGRISSTDLLEKNLSMTKMVQIKAQANELSKLNSGENVQTKPMLESTKYGVTAPESSYAVSEKNIISSFTSVSADPPSGVNGKTFNFKIPMSRTQSIEIVSAAQFSPIISVRTPAISPHIPSNSPSSPFSVSAAPSSSPSATAFSGSLPSTKPAMDANQTGLSAATTFSGSLPSTKPLMDANQTGLSPPSSSVSSTPSMLSGGPFSFQPPESEVSSPIPVSSETAPSQPKPPSGARLEPALSPAPASEVSSGLASGSQPGMLSTPNFNMFGTASNASSNPQPEVQSAAHALFPAPSAATDGKNEGLDLAITQEDEMEEEAPDLTTELNWGALGGVGLGSTPGTPFASAAPNPSTSPFTLTIPSGEMFRPASFGFPSVQPQPSPPTNLGVFSPGFGTSSTGSGFGQPAQIGAGQQALGSVLGAFGQSRQLGTGLPGIGFATSTGYSGGGFSAAAPSSGGFAGAATGGFAGVASTGGGFAGVSGGGGFAAAASGGGGFAAAASAASAGGGFTGAVGGGFGAFSSQQGSGGFSGFSGSKAAPAGKPSELFTQMRR